MRFLFRSRTVLTEPSRASLIDHAGALDGLALRRPNSRPKSRIRAHCRSGIGARDWCDYRGVQCGRCRLAPPTAIPGAGPSGMGRSLVSKDGARVHVRPDYLEWSQQNHVFENLTAFDSTSCDLTGGDEPWRLLCGTVTQTFFAVIGVQPVLGAVSFRRKTSREDRGRDTHCWSLATSFWRGPRRPRHSRHFGR